MVCEKDKLIITHLKCGLDEFIKSEKNGFNEPEYIEEEFLQSENNPQHVGIINNFINAIIGIEPFYVDGKEGINCVELFDLMLLSSWLNREVYLPLNDELYYEELKKRIDSSIQKKSEDLLIDNSMSFEGTK